jgi:enoyl-CoA hydratase/carnithine racemase
VRYEVVDRVARITMCRAPVNALDHALVEAILAAYRRADADAQARAIVLTSAFDRAFSAGMDLAMIRGRSGLDLRRRESTKQSSGTKSLLAPALRSEGPC